MYELLKRVLSVDLQVLNRDLKIENFIFYIIRNYNCRSFQIMKVRERIEIISETEN